MSFHLRKLFNMLLEIAKMAITLQYILEAFKQLLIGDTLGIVDKPPFLRKTVKIAGRTVSRDCFMQN